MRFHNSGGDNLSFVIDRISYEVPVGASVEIPDNLAYCIDLRGYPLSKDGGTPGASVAKGKKLRAANRPKAERASAKETAEELADLTGEDEPEEGFSMADDDSDVADAAEKTLKQLERQGIRLPSRKKS